MNVIKNKKGAVNPLFIVLGSLLALVLVLGISYVNIKNGLVRWEIQTDTAWAQVENVLQRRVDLIPNLVNTVKGYAKHEQGIIEKVAEARQSYVGARTPADKMAASNQLEGALSRLLVFTENYPNLKADAVFTRLMDELAGTENRIAVERNRYNEVVSIYNTKIRQIPYSLFAGGREPKPFFKAAPGAEEAPKVAF